MIQPDLESCQRCSYTPVKGTCDLSVHLFTVNCKRILVCMLGQYNRTFWFVVAPTTERGPSSLRLCHSRGGRIGEHGISGHRRFPLGEKSLRGMANRGIIDQVLVYFFVELQGESR